MSMTTPSSTNAVFTSTKGMPVNDLASHSGAGVVRAVSGFAATVSLKLRIVTPAGSDANDDNALDQRPFTRTTRCGISDAKRNGSASAREISPAAARANVTLAIGATL